MSWESPRAKQVNQLNHSCHASLTTSLTPQYKPPSSHMLALMAPHDPGDKRMGPSPILRDEPFVTELFVIDEIFSFFLL